MISECKPHQIEVLYIKKVTLDWKAATVSLIRLDHNQIQRLHNYLIRTFTFTYEYIRESDTNTDRSAQYGDGILLPKFDFFMDHQHHTTPLLLTYMMNHKTNSTPNRRKTKRHSISQRKRWIASPRWR